MEQHPDVRNALACATARATAAGQPSANLCDLLICLLGVPEVEEMLTQSGGSVQVLLSGLTATEARPSETPARARRWAAFLPRGLAAGGFGVRRALHAARIQRRAASKHDVRATDLFVAACSQPSGQLASVLERASVSRLRLLKWLCHRNGAASPSSMVSSEFLEVVVLNDDYTPMKTVVEILQKVFGMSAWTAFKTMRVVHRQGSGSAGTFARDVALRNVANAVMVAERAGAPLKFALRQGAPPA